MTIRDIATVHQEGTDTFQSQVSPYVSVSVGQYVEYEYTSGKNVPAGVAITIRFPVRGSDYQERTVLLDPDTAVEFITAVRKHITT
jgi:hypothetical protein